MQVRRLSAECRRHINKLTVALPLLLAGPILRRVEPTLVCVWVALRQTATLKLSLWEGRVVAGAGNVLIDSEPRHARVLRVGENLFIGVVALKIEATSPRVLQPDRSYSYDLAITIDGEAHTLKSLGLLKTGEVDGRHVEALGFDDFQLPSFALPPTELTDLRIAFGSCRRPANAHLDAMVYIDDVMSDGAACSHTELLKRPHQLFLGGDQIYADDVSPLHLSHLIELGRALIGSDANGDARERLPLDHVRKAAVGAPAGFDHYGPDIARGSSGAQDADFLLPADAAHFPAGRRLLLSTVEAQMTTTDGRSHLLSLGEFAAMYLSVWSNAVWPPLTTPPEGGDAVLALPAARTLIEPVWPSIIPTHIDAPLNADETRDPGETEAAKLSPFRNYDPLKKAIEDDGGTVEKSLDGHLAPLTDFERGLAKVRRVLANIPTYMIFDDHDVTDDWNLNPTWMDRVLTTSLGVATLRNALVSYALFQDWGNDPLRYEEDGAEPKRLLERIEALYPGTQMPGPDATAANDIDALFGLNLRGVMDIDGSVSETRPPMKWHFSVPGPKHLAVALDNRTRRSFVSRNGPPGNVAVSAMTDQIPAGPFTDAKEVLLVIAPLQVFGPPLLDELVAPASYRMFDMIGFGIKGKAKSGLKAGSRGMVGSNPDAIEAWAFDAKTFEALLERLEPYRQVVLLSGDVHYSASNAMSYWKKGRTDPARLIQFTSSGLKNVMPSYITTVDRCLPYAQNLIRAGVGAERLGWKIKPSMPVLLGAGKSERDIPRALRAKLRHEPVMVPTYGWPAGSTINLAQTPDWSWRVEPVFDLRPDGTGPGTRPLAAQPLTIDTGAVLRQLGEAESVGAFQALAARHQRALETLRNSRQILFRSNFGLVRFERRDGVLHAIYEAYTSFKATGEIGRDRPLPEPFMVHDAALADPAAPRPESQLKPLAAKAEG